MSDEFGLEFVVGHIRDDFKFKKEIIFIQRFDFI